MPVSFGQSDEVLKKHPKGQTHQTSLVCLQLMKISDTFEQTEPIHFIITYCNASCILYYSEITGDNFFHQEAFLTLKKRAEGILYAQRFQQHTLSQSSFTKL